MQVALILVITLLWLLQMIPLLRARPDEPTSMLLLPCDALLSNAHPRVPQTEPALVRMMLQLLPALIK